MPPFIGEATSPEELVSKLKAARDQDKRKLTSGGDKMEVRVKGIYKPYEVLGVISALRNMERNKDIQEAAFIKADNTAIRVRRQPYGYLVHREAAPNLLVAAPKMLVALQAVAQCLQPQPIHDQVRRKHEIEQAADLVYEAIAQATGQKHDK